MHGLDLADRELIFSSLLPEEKFVDRRIYTFENIALESESETEGIDFIEQKVDPNFCKYPFNNLLNWIVLGGGSREYSTVGSQKGMKGLPRGSSLGSKHSLNNNRVFSPGSS